MDTNIERVHAQIAKIEDVVLDKACMVKDLTDFLGFYYSYQSTYIPLLEFAAEVLPENDLAKLANFGMLVDNLCGVQLDRILSVQQLADAREISTRTDKPESDVLALLQNVTIAQKAHISSVLLMASSFARDFTLCAANSKFNAINKILIWANALGKFIDCPALAELFVNEQLISEAESDLLDAKSRIAKKDRAYDYDLAGTWAPQLHQSRIHVQELPKFFIGPKVAWLMAMEGLELAKCIMNKDVEAGQAALLYNEKIAALLGNKNVSSNEWAYRNVNSRGPCCDVHKLVCMNGTDQLGMVPVDSHTILVHTPAVHYFIIIPSTLAYYVSPDMARQVSADLDIPLTHDIQTIIAFHRNPARFVASNVAGLSPPSESIFFLTKKKDREKLKRIVADIDSFAAKLAITYSDKVNPVVVDFVSRTVGTSLEAIVLYGLLVGMEQIGKCAGLPINSDLWSQGRAFMTGALLTGLKGFTRKAEEISQGSEEEASSQVEGGTVPLNTEDKVQLLYKKIDESREAMTGAIKEMQDAGMNSIMEVSQHIREILLSGLSMEEIVEKLRDYCSSVGGESEGAQ